MRMVGKIACRNALLVRMLCVNGEKGVDVIDGKR